MLRYSPLAVASRTNLKMAVCKGYRGNEYNFIQDPSDSLICQICYSVASCPQQHSECGKLFCETCVEDYRAKNDQGTCPNCRQEFFTKIFSDYRGKKTATIDESTAEIFTTRVDCTCGQ